MFDIIDLTKFWIYLSVSKMSKHGQQNKMPVLPSAEQFYTLQNELLSLEKEEEAVRNREILTNKNNIKQLERQGIALRKIIIQERRTGLYGKSILVFGNPSNVGKDASSSELPANTLSNGK